MIDEKLKNDISSIATNSQELLDRCISSLDEIDRANAKAIADIEARTNNLVKSFSNSFEVSVGVGGDFTTLKDAINYYSNYRAKAGAGNTKITIVLLENFILKEKFSYSDTNLSHIIITSKNKIIQCDYADTEPSLIFGFLNTKAPYFYECNFTFINKPQILLFLHHRSNLIMGRCTVDKCAKLAHMHANSHLRLHDSTISNSTVGVFHMNENAVLSSYKDTFINVPTICSADSASAAISTVKISNISNACFSLSRGARVMVASAVYLNAPTRANIAANTFTSAGVFSE